MTSVAPNPRRTVDYTRSVPPEFASGELYAEQFRAIVDATPECVKLVRADGTLLHMNPPGLAMIGAESPNAVVGKSVYELIVPEHRDAFRAFNQRICEGEKGSLQFDIVGLQGTRLHMETHAVPFQKPDGEVVQLALTRDISERKEAEALLSAERRVLEQIAAGAPMSKVLETLARETEANSSENMLCSILLTDENGERLLHGAAPSLPDAYNRAIDGICIGPGVGSCGTAAYERKPVFVTDIATDPAWTNFKDLAAAHGLGSCCSTPIFSTQGELLGTVAMYYRQPHNPSARDRKLIGRGTQLAAIAIERKRAEEALRVSEKRYRELLNALPVAVYTTDADGRITLFNEAATGLAGRHAEAGKDEWCVTHRLYRSDGTFLPHDECPMAVTLRTGEPQRDVEAIAERPDGTRAWFIPHPTAVRDASGKITGGINVLVDITERKLAEDRQRQAEIALRKSEKFAVAGRMAAAIAHEINNPLEAMMNLWFLLGQEDLSPEGQTQLKMLGDELARVSHITKQTLEFYREGKSAAMFDLTGPIDAAVNLFSRMAQSKGTRIETDYRTSATLFGFAGELRQVFANLIGNSVEAGSTSIKIRVSAARDCDRNENRGPAAETARRGVRVVLADNGSGISTESARKLFEPFFTTKEEKGTGLGLWVSKGIVQKHDGWIRMHTSTQPGRGGTTFCMFLPTLQDSFAAPQKVRHGTAFSV